MSLNHIFSSFYSQTNLNETVDVSVLEKGAYACRKQDKGISNSNQGGWHSSLYNSLGPNIKQDLIQEINNQLRVVSKEFGITNAEVSVSWFWFNINGKKDFNKLHSHQTSIFSGVYYVKVPPNSGRLVFDAPHMELMVSYLNYWHLECQGFNEFNSNNWSVAPSPGDLVIFPSWLPHYVEPNASDEDRISISFNTQVIR